MKIDWKKEIKLPKPSLSALKRDRSILVKGKGPSLKRPKALSAGPEIKMPRFLGDLYGDLRERHLLPLVVLLIAAIVAVPILLNKSGGYAAETPVAAAPTTGNEAPASSFSVVPAARRLRSPEERLGHRTALDPFRAEAQQQQKESGGNGAGAKATTGTSSGSSAGSPSGGTESAAPRSAEIKVTETPEGGKELTIKESTTTTTTVPPTSEPAATETSAAAPAPPAKESKPAPSEVAPAQTEVVEYTIDLKAGDPSGELTGQEDVAPMTRLPSAKNPLVVFTGLSQDDKRALFLMTSKVTAYYGAVHCVVDKQACQMIELTPGKPAIFEFAEGEAEGRYKVVLEKIEPVVKAQPGVEREVETTIRKTTTKRRAGAKGESPTPRGYALSTARRFSK
jgi:hypothetical protein